MPRFALFRRGEIERSLVLDQDVVRIGRLSGLEITLDARTVSREHARILRDGAGLVLEDLDSVNGVRLNGKPIKNHVLRAGDEIEIEDFRIVFEPSEEVFAAGLAPELRRFAGTLGRSDPNLTFLNINRFVRDE